MAWPAVEVQYADEKQVRFVTAVVPRGDHDEHFARDVLVDMTPYRVRPALGNLGFDIVGHPEIDTHPSVLAGAPATVVITYRIRQRGFDLVGFRRQLEMIVW